MHARVLGASETCHSKIATTAAYHMASLIVQGNKDALKAAKNAQVRILIHQETEPKQ